MTESIIELSVIENSKVDAKVKTEVGTKVNIKVDDKAKNTIEQKGVVDDKEKKARTLEEILKDFYINPDSDMYILDSKFDICIKGDSKKITGRQSLLAKPIIKFFNNVHNLRKIIPILNSTSRISLRIIDWFITNYCKENGTMFNKKIYELNDKLILKKWLTDAEKEEYDNNIKLLEEYKKEGTKLSSFDNFIIIHNDYKSQLKSYNKINFDPFCRRNRINLYYVKGKYISTTIGQLNFFKWVIENYIINYILENIIDIENNMAKQLEDRTTDVENDEDNKEKEESNSDSSNDEQIKITQDEVIGEVKQNDIQKDIEINKRVITRKVIKKNSGGESGSGKGKQPDKSIKKKVDIKSSGVNSKNIEDLSKKKQRKRKVIGTTKKRKKEKNNVNISNKSMIRHNYPTIINFD